MLEIAINEDQISHYMPDMQTSYFIQLFLNLQSLANFDEIIRLILANELEDKTIKVLKNNQQVTTETKHKVIYSMLTQPIQK